MVGSGHHTLPVDVHGAHCSSASAIRGELSIYYPCPRCPLSFFPVVLPFHNPPPALSTHPCSPLNPPSPVASSESTNSSRLSSILPPPLAPQDQPAAAALTTTSCRRRRLPRTDQQQQTQQQPPPVARHSPYPIASLPPRPLAASPRRRPGPPHPGG
jgi:hypothetical protein